MKFLIFLSGLMVTHLSALSTEIQVGYFRPSSETMREVYGEAWPNFGISVDQVAFFPKVTNNLSLFGALNFLPKSGNSLNGGQSTSILIFPITLGLKWVQPIFSFMDFYFGGAPRYYLTWIHNHSSYVPKHDFMNGFGGFGVAGFFFYPIKHLLLDIEFGYGFRTFGASSTPSGSLGFPVNVGGA
jgi:hypothetical protein